MNYIELCIEIPEQKEYLTEILIAFLAEQEFESFADAKGSLKAYIPEKSFDEKETEKLLQRYNLNFFINKIEQQNWNKKWEENYDPIVVDDKLAIIAPFHNQIFNTEYKILIEPKMSFGTGHHATTYMMSQLISEYSMSEASVLDMGCGTGVLAIYASMLGAASVIAIDIDEWAYENTIENIQRNNISNVVVIKGDVTDIPQKKFDYIFANINLNILKRDIPQYSNYMDKGAFLFLSGFFETELNQITTLCKDYGLFFAKSIVKENWIACIFHKHI
ncbi:MAG: 50S ribosomal protein L11 methyltransferase [Bacteroidales bacterium]|jgi:ribosomal protein L11 methyltransferase|nr:50S ribosomal protein L11 methyltransferase [Bacteroidales bacterium]MDD4215793.1 50S ribosomal protein L11 methyltransferase [Bacteroidales bacterium]MDY0142191.1 50S ribosomal protein L11 methyltransferase [Bacteroidales bacterium]